MSFLTAQDIADLSAINVAGAQTMATVNGVDLVLGRWNPQTEKHEPRPAQRAAVKFANHAAQRNKSESASALMVDGVFSKPAPFDVLVGDVFAFGDAGKELTGTITIVFPTELGVTKAGWLLQGER